MTAAMTSKWAKGSGGPAGDEAQNLVAAPLEASDGHHGYSSPRGDGADNLIADTATAQGVRRLTPRECERLQGFPDDWTLIPGASDSKRYAALGDAVTVPVARWIGERLQRYAA